jgi:hypothetical protein
MPLFLGIDTGTSGTKAVLIDETGNLLASYTQEYELSTPFPQWAEQHPDTDWWEACSGRCPGGPGEGGRFRRPDRRHRTDRTDARIGLSR